MYALTSLVLLLGVTDVTYRAELQQRSRIDFRQFNGRWKVARATCGGRDHTAEFEKLELFLDGDCVWARNLRDPTKEPFVLISRPPCVDPDFLDRRALDLLFSIHGLPIRAILTMEDDQLTVAWSMKAGEAGEHRPKSFDRSQPDIFIAVLKKLSR